MKKNIFKSVFILLTTTLFLTSCLKKQNLDEQNLGPAINTDELQSKMSASIGNLRYSDINLNEINSFTAATTFEETHRTPRYKQDLFVTKLTNTTNLLTIDFMFNKLDYLNSDNSLSNQPYQMLIDTTPSSSSSIQMTSDLTPQIAKNIQAQAASPTPFFLYRAYAYFAIQGCREDKVSCYNLKTQNSKMYLKAILASPKYCPDINNCIVDVKKIEFDMLDAAVLSAEGKPYRTHYTFLVSPQLPFLSKVMSYCVRGLTDYGGRKVLAEDCMDLDNFSYGQEH